jgi:GcrA cell cycle regulator
MDRSSNKFTDWNHMLVELIKKLWIEGRSAGEIGAQIGVSRNAVIGKIHRSGLNKNSRQVPKLAAELPKTTVEPVRKMTTVEPVRKILNPPKQAAPPEPVVQGPQGGISLAQLRYRRTCAFPISGIGADLRYCGSGTNGTPYCKSCSKKMYVKSTYRRK